ncbi:MAG: hypothetical protein KAT48_04590, partial [Bacteroidales bacterium]|nr:hypothetical protein [Bacteroidales bacterium]
RNIIILIVFFLVYLALGSATGVNSSSPGESADILNESLPQDETFSFGTLNILDGNNNPLFCMVTLYDNAGISKVSDFTNTLSIEKINPGSHLNIESNDNNILLDFSINGDSFDPVVRVADYGISNPTSNYELYGSALKYVSVDTVNLSYSNLRMAISYSGLDEDIDTSKLKIFKYVETFAYNEWIELPTHIDEINQAVWTDIDSTSIFAVSITDSTAQSQNITIGDVSLLNSIGIPQPGEITIIGPEGNIIAGSAGTLTLDEAPSGSHLNIYSSETNTRLDFTLNTDSSNPVILLEDFGTNNPAGDYSPPGEPVKYLMIGAENLGYSGVNLTLYYPDISGNHSIYRLSETFAYNEWEELPAVVDTANNTITTSLDSLSIFALCKITPVGVRVLDNTNAPLTVEIKTYDYNKNPRIVKRGHTLSVDELPKPGYIEIDALVEKDIAVVFKSSYSSGGEIILENYARHNPAAIDPNRIPVKFVEIHATNLKYDSADIEIHYSDDEIGSLDENKLQIAHFSGGAWVTLDSTVDPVNNMVRASTDSLSTFALVYNGTSVNTKKSIYQPGEMAEIMIVVLDSAGVPVSDASIRMNVTAPEGSVEYFSTVTGSIVETLDPGVYEAAYLTGGEGQYDISCTAIIEGSESGFDTYFMVQSEYDFDIIRHAQGKIDPTKYDTFDIGLDIISYTDAGSIIIWEYVPAVFEVYTDASVVEADNLKVLTWQRSLVNNRTSVNYSYSVPMEWPKLYQLGPVEIDYGNETFTEARPWWVAVDPTTFDEPPDTAVNDDDDDVLAQVNTSNNIRATLTVEDPDRTDYIESNWSDNGIPTGSTITSVTYYCEHIEDTDGDKANLTIEWWDGSTWTVVCNPAETKAETTHSCNLNSYINTVTEANNVSLRYKWTWIKSKTDTSLDYEHLKIEYATGDNNSAPFISNVTNSTPTDSQVYINWTTNQSDSDNRVKYSLNSDLSGYTWSGWDNNTPVNISLTSLSPSTKYYYSAYSYNGTNNSLYSNSSIFNFTTAGTQETTYDFSSGNGTNKWAYRYQIYLAEPPTSNNVPAIQFTSDQYNKIKTDDGDFQNDTTDDYFRFYYTAHRFVFNISESAETITKIYVLWNGIGYHEYNFDTDGATLYIWNYNDENYEELDTTTSDSEVNLTGEITANFGNYIDTDGNLTVLVEQHDDTRKTGGGGGNWYYPHIKTDYIKVNITFTAENHPPSMETPKTYNSSLTERNIFEICENVTIRVNVTDPEGADDIDTVLIKLIHPNSTVMVNNVSMTNISGITKGYIYEYNYTVPEELASKGYWIVQVYANDTSDAKADTLTFFKIISLNVTVDAGGPYNPGDTVYIDGRVLYANGTPVDQAAVELNSTDLNNNVVNYTTVYTNASGYFSANYTLNDTAIIGIYTVKANVTKGNLQQ